MQNTTTEKHSILGIVYPLSFGLYALIFALMNHIGDLAAALCTAALLIFQLSYIVVLRKLDRLPFREAFMKGAVSSVSALAVVILEMYIDFFVCGMSTTNAITGEMKLVTGLDIFRVNGTDKLMNVFFVTLFVVCVAFAAVYAHTYHRNHKS
ncbi:hypothetical protein SAMN02910447_00712 [Ruminococcus sp. YE71]|uniref:hypothetical protein n=1 Tax=unclassified Ruminococcus TaxID=2608920 RepID=UPI00088B8B8D|nr:MULTISPECIES: hypothetical protein [unclassified Ruminococcus]SDA13762.1 hypothetical protein SAMN02910446_00711 [Ruminococcus sp. YE78]SFW19645.1 hypothetical protein SAMN02910447_00712 [Ruminococcus sp. YE71]